MSLNVSEKYSINDIIDINDLRQEYIRLLDKKLSKEEMYSISDDLFSLGLTVYSGNLNLDSIIYNSISKSTLDKNISLYPEQVYLLDAIQKNNALIVSAPTSFGKTFCIFEYIARELPKNVVLIVPTLALVDEYLKKIISKYKNTFRKYKKFINFDFETKINYDDYNLFVLTHDKVVENANYNLIKKIDFLVIDEVYKLQKDDNNDRVLILNLAYYYLSQLSQKYVLLAPFISDIEDREKLDKKPILFKTDFSPVVNELETIEVNSFDEKKKYINEILKNHIGEKTLIYFPTVAEIPNFVNDNLVKNYPVIRIKDRNILNFIKWVKDEIHEEWYVVKAMERGFLIHNGQLLNNGFRMYQLDLYDSSNEFYTLLCTATILEGVNLSAKNIIITKPYRFINKFDAFDFYNLVGRTGRLYQHKLGYAYYLKEPNDPKYIKSDAIKSIKFEATDISEDFDFHIGNDADCNQYEEFINKLHITSDEYKENIGAKYKIKTISETYDKFLEEKSKLVEELELLYENKERARSFLIKIIYSIINYEEKRPYIINHDSYLINKLIDKRRFHIKTIINNIMSNNKKANIDWEISTILRLKSSFIEHDFYNKCKIIIYFMKCNGIDENLIEIINQKIISGIEFIYFSDSKCKKTLKDIGIYEYDIDKIVNVIGNDLDNVNDIYEELKKNKFENLNFLSEYIISRL